MPGFFCWQKQGTCFEIVRPGTRKECYTKHTTEKGVGLGVEKNALHDTYDSFVCSLHGFPCFSC